MTYVLDAFALVALGRNERAAADVEALVRRGNAVVVATNLAEALDVLQRVGGRPLARLRDEFALLLGEAVRVLPTDEKIAWRAAELRGRHYRRRDAQVSLADCIALAAASEGGSIVTADAPLIRAAKAEDISVVELLAPLPEA